MGRHNKLVQRLDEKYDSVLNSYNIDLLSKLKVPAERTCKYGTKTMSAIP